MEIIAKKIDNKIKELSRELSIDKYIMVLDYLKDIIFSDNPTFYISKDGIVICFSSYELDSSISDLSTFKISFKEDRKISSLDHGTDISSNGAGADWHGPGHQPDVRGGGVYGWADLPELQEAV